VPGPTRVVWQAGDSVQVVPPLTGDGTWTHIVTGLQVRTDANDLITWDVSVDSARRSRPAECVMRQAATGSGRRAAGW
jgi:hypothetical protein